MNKFIVLLAALSILFPSFVKEKYGDVPREESRIVTILTYHDFSHEPIDNDMTVSKEAFRKQLTALKEKGYTAISMRELISYSQFGNELPEKPFMITIDDGYESNYLIAYEILEELDMPAVISVIGWSVGKNTHLDNKTPITPHFTWETAKKMYDSGLIEIQNHSYNMHSTPFDNPLFNTDGRNGLMQIIGESQQEYETKIKADIQRNKELIETNVGNNNVLFCYPYGLKNETTEKICAELGFKITMTTKKGVNYIRPGDSLFSLNRITIYEDTTADVLDAYIKDQTAVVRKNYLINSKQKNG